MGTKEYKSRMKKSLNFNYHPSTIKIPIDGQIMADKTIVFIGYDIRIK